MPTIDELLREELKRVTDAVQAEQLRPLRPPAPGPGRRLRLLPAAVGATVIAIAIAIVAALPAGPPARPQLHVAPAPVTAMPRYYVTVAETTSRTEAVVRDSRSGQVTGTAALPSFFNPVSYIVASADERTFVLAIDMTITGTPGSASFRFYRLPVSADGRPGRPVELPQSPQGAPVVTGISLSPDGTRLAVSLEYATGFTVADTYGGIQVINLATGTSRTWIARNYETYWPGTPSWENGDTTVAFTWWHLTSATTGAAAITGIRELDTSAPGSNLLAARLIPFTTPTPFAADHQSAIITSDGREIVAAACRDTAPLGSWHGHVTAQIIELSTAGGRLLRVLRTQTVRYSTGEEHDTLGTECTLLSANPSGDHLLVQAFGFGRLDNGVFTPLPAPADLNYLAAGW
jgi:hypothetical protein